MPRKSKKEECILECEDESVRTVKCCLKKHLYDTKAHVPVIEELVQHISIVCRNASMFTNLFLLHVLRSNNGIIPDYIDVSNQNFFQRCMTICCDSFRPCIDDEEVRSMIAFRKSEGMSVLFDSVKQLRRKGDTQLINEASRMYQTNFENHHIVPQFQRMKKYLMSRVGKDVWKNLSVSEKYKLTKYTWDESSQYPENEALQIHREWVTELRSRYLHIRSFKDNKRIWVNYFRNAPKDAEGITEKNEVLKKCERDYRTRLVEFTYWLGVQLNAYYEDTLGEQPMPFESRNKKIVIQPGGHKTFSIAPICDIRRQSIVLSTSTVKGLHEMFEIPKCYEKEPLDWIFRMEKIKRFKSSKGGWHLQGTLRTDGVSLSVVFQKKQEKKKMIPHRPIDQNRIIAIDPGSINIYFGVERMSDGSCKTYKYTTKQYYHEAYVWKKKKYMDTRKKTCEDVLQKLSQCVKKTVVLDLQLKYWETYASNWKKLFDCLGCRRRNKLDMNVYMKGNKSIDGFLSSLKGDSNIIPSIAYGAGKFSSTIRGTLSTPNSRAFLKCKRRYNTVLIEEYNTSQYCPHCSKKLTTPKEPKICRDGITRMFDSRSVKRCTSPECLREALVHPLETVRKIAEDPKIAAYEMSRDKVGALNILRCATEIPRPAHLCRNADSQWHPPST